MKTFEDHRKEMLENVAWYTEQVNKRKEERKKEERTRYKRNIMEGTTRRIIGYTYLRHIRKRAKYYFKGVESEDLDIMAEQIYFDLKGVGLNITSLLTDRNMWWLLAPLQRPGLSVEKELGMLYRT